MNRLRPQDDAPEAHPGPNMRSSSESYFSDLHDEVRFLTPARRTASWESDDTVVRAEDGLLHHKGDDRSSVDFDLDDDSYTSRPRRRPWVKFGILCGATLL